LIPASISFVGSYSDYLDDPEDYVGHGTHVAGIAAVHTNNGAGVAGIGWNSSLGNLKTCFAYQIDLLPPLGIYVTVGVCPVSSSAAAITHAADNGYHVINMSYGSDEVDTNGDPAGVPAQPNTETTAISYAWSQGVVLVAAAGNDNNSTRIYPAANDDVIAVGATDHFDNLASFSSFSVPGDHWVALMAPGADILSTAPVADCVFLADLLGYPFGMGAPVSRPVSAGLYQPKRRPLQCGGAQPPRIRCGYRGRNRTEFPVLEPVRAAESPGRTQRCRYRSRWPARQCR
jgi:subtilisin family serine protease